MSSLHVCARSQVPASLASSGAGWVISALARADRLPDLGGIAPERRLHLALSDINEPTPDYVLAEAAHLVELLAFLQRWDRASPLLIHCYAGVSRSTAVGFVAQCFFAPDQAEIAHARQLRRFSPTATPNRRIVTLADAVMGREGRMIEAVAAIGRGADCFEGTPFTLPVPSMGAADAGA